MPKRKVDPISILLWLLVLATLTLPLMMFWDILKTGLPHLSYTFMIESPKDAGRSGGIFPIIVSTFWILGICLLCVIPLGLACAIYLSECVEESNPFARFISLSLDVLSAVPSIVFGLFGYAVFAIELGFGFSILSGGLSLACMVLPLFIRTSEQALRTCPLSYKQAAEALNIRFSSFVSRILLPSTSFGIAAALIISIARALAETAVLIFTAGYVTRLPEHWTDSGRALSVHIYDLAMNVPGGQGNASTSALVLIIFIIVINISARRLSTYWQR